MLTREILTANAELSGLTDAQIKAIETLSQNDENSVLGTRIGEIYRNMDNTIATATGIQRNGDEKTYLYLERAVKDIVTKSNGFSAQIAELTKEKSRLEKVIAEGGADAETKKQLAQAQKDLANVQKQFTEVQAELTTAKQKHEREMFDLRISNDINAETKGLTFKPELPQSATDILLEQAIAKVKGMKPTYIDDGKGGKTLAFATEDGTILRNKANGLNPYTAGELIREQLTEMGVLATTAPTGSGTEPPKPNPNATISLAGVKTQREAMDAIHAHLNQKGLVIGTDEYQEALNKAWADNNIQSLPF